MPIARVVVIEDEPAIRRGVVDALRASGYDPGRGSRWGAGCRRGTAARRRSDLTRPSFTQAGRARSANGRAQSAPDPPHHHTHSARNRRRSRPRAQDGRRRLCRQTVLRAGVTRPCGGPPAPICGPANGGTGCRGGAERLPAWARDGLRAQFPGILAERPRPQ
jgi:hypothetical protein